MKEKRRGGKGGKERGRESRIVMGSSHVPLVMVMGSLRSAWVDLASVGRYCVIGCKGR